MKWVLLLTQIVSQPWLVGLASQFSAFQKIIVLGEMWKISCTKLTLSFLFKTQGVPHIPKRKAP